MANTLFSTGISDKDDGFSAGEEAASIALRKLGSSKKPDVAITFISAEYNYEEALKGLEKIIGNVPILGCSSAGEFTEEKVAKKAIACALISSETHKFYQGYSNHLKKNPLKAVETASQNFPKEVPDFPYPSAMLLIDGLAGQGEEAVLAASSVLGPKVKIFGGAAADNLDFKKTVVFDKGKALSDSVSVGFAVSKKPIMISVKHGHTPLSEPLNVTKSKGNILYEINGKQALEVWKEKLKETSDSSWNDFKRAKSSTDISKILLRHEAGLMTGSNYKVRFPVSANPDGSLNFVCTITEGSVIKIMDSNEQGQIRSAREAAEQAIVQARGIKIAGALIFDCVCRSSFLKEKFKDAVAEIKKVLKDIPFIGFETYGEIAMEVGQFSGFHNATTVIVLIPE
jgi:methyl-accepting chemotaxis protein